MKKLSFKSKCFSHPHDLELIKIPKENQQINCSACEVYLFGSCYTCPHCNFSLRKSCFHLPPIVTNPMHPQHPLTLLAPPYSGGHCDTCRDKCDSGLSYSCRYCHFNIHSRCARLHETEPRDDRERYFLNFLHRILCEQKKLVALLAPVMMGQPAQLQHLHQQQDLHGTEPRGGRRRYFLNLLRGILSEKKKLEALLAPVLMGPPAAQQHHQRQDLQGRRMRMYNNQIQRMAGSQNQLSVVGTTSYEFSRNNNSYIG